MPNNEIMSIKFYYFRFHFSFRSNQTEHYRGKSTQKYAKRILRHIVDTKKRIISLKSTRGEVCDTVTSSIFITKK